MESPSRALILSIPPPAPPPHSATSPEFEFWNSARNNQEPVHSADELFSDGFLLPLHSLSSPRSKPVCDFEPGSKCEEVIEPGSFEPSAHITSVVSSNGSSVLSASKRWREIIFKRTEKKTVVNDDVSGHLSEESNNKCEKVVEKRREKERRNKPGSGSGSAELNINLWPFSRSRSAGNEAASRSEKSVGRRRKASSAPCSRSNSSGGSERRAWPGSPARTGVQLGRAGPVWQPKRAGPGSGKAGSLGYRVRCGGDERGAVVGGDGSGGAIGKSGGGGGNGGLFGFRGLFGKKSSGTVLTV